MATGEEPIEPLTATTPAVERAVALLLGAAESVADRVVTALEATGRLGDGVLLVAMLGAARWGTDARGALGRIADGADPPGGWSAYELRVAAAEAREEAAQLLAAAPASAGQRPADGPEQAVAALQAGAAALTVPQRAGQAAAVERAWLMRLCVKAGVTLRDDEAQPPAGEPSAAPADATVARTEGYLDLLV